jgi:hypothetical protein
VRMKLVFIPPFTFPSYNSLYFLLGQMLYVTECLLYRYSLEKG